MNNWKSNWAGGNDVTQQIKCADTYVWKQSWKAGLNHWLGSTEPQ